MRCYRCLSVMVKRQFRTARCRCEYRRERETCIIDQRILNTASWVPVYVSSGLSPTVLNKLFGLILSGYPNLWKPTWVDDM